VGAVVVTAASVGVRVGLPGLQDARARVNTASARIGLKPRHKWDKFGIASHCHYTHKYESYWMGNSPYFFAPGQLTNMKKLLFPVAKAKKLPV
jgi:hypothetical protein